MVWLPGSLSLLGSGGDLEMCKLAPTFFFYDKLTLWKRVWALVFTIIYALYFFVFNNLALSKLVEKMISTGDLTSHCNLYVRVL